MSGEHKERYRSKPGWVGLDTLSLPFPRVLSTLLSILSLPGCFSSRLSVGLSTHISGPVQSLPLTNRGSCSLRFCYLHGLCESNMLQTASTSCKHFVVVHIWNINYEHNLSLMWVVDRSQTQKKKKHSSINHSSSPILLSLNWSHIIGTLYKKGQKDFYRHSGQHRRSWVNRQ